MLSTLRSDGRLFGDGFLALPRLMGSCSCLSKIIADVCLPWHCVNKPRNDPNQQAAFLEAVTLYVRLLFTYLISGGISDLMFYIATVLYSLCIGCIVVVCATLHLRHQTQGGRVDCFLKNCSFLLCVYYV